MQKLLGHYMRAFDTVEELRLALREWRQLYKAQWLVERHGHRSPAAVRREYRATSQSEAA